MKNKDAEILTNRRVVLGVCSSIAICKAPEIVSQLVRLGADVRVIMTKNAAKLVSERIFQTLSHNPVACDMWEKTGDWRPEHVSLADFAELMIVAPATANAIGNFANGLAPDFLSSTFLATTAKILIAPAMNCKMYSNFAVQNNIAVLQKNGVEFVGPEEGVLACGISGKGRMSEPEKIVESAVEILKSLKTEK